MPGLVFIGDGGYSLYAVKDDYPTPGTRLFNPPCPNVSNGVCQGNAKFPQPGRDTIWEAVEVFFTSGFNSHLADNKSQAHKTILNVWRTLDAQGAETYPLTDLVPAHRTLGQVIDG